MRRYRIGELRCEGREGLCVEVEEGVCRRGLDTAILFENARRCANVPAKTKNSCGIVG